MAIEITPPGYPTLAVEQDGGGTIYVFIGLQDFVPLDRQQAIDFARGILAMVEQADT